MAGYATAAQVKEYLAGVDLTILGNSTAQDAACDAASSAATSWIESQCQRTFSTVTEERAFDGGGLPKLFLPDVRTITAWKIDGVTQTLGDLLLYPLNATPTQWVQRKYGAEFPEDQTGGGNVKITGSWGYGSSVPTGILVACQQRAAADILRRVAPYAGQGATQLTQGLLGQQYRGGIYDGEIRRLEAAAEAQLAGFYRGWA